MMKYFAIVVLIFLMGCNHSGSDKAIGTTSDTAKTSNSVSQATMPAGFEKLFTNSKDKSLRGQALSIINHRINKLGLKTVAFLEADVWEYQFVFSGDMSKPGEYTNHWIDFRSDHTYEYGIGSDVYGRGKYSFVEDREELVLVDNNENIKPQEWSVKYGGDMLVLVGTQSYADNHMQMKLERRPDTFRN